MEAAESPAPARPHGGLARGKDHDDSDRCRGRAPYAEPMCHRSPFAVRPDEGCQKASRSRLLLRSDSGVGSHEPKPLEQSDRQHVAVGLMPGLLVVALVVILRRVERPGVCDLRGDGAIEGGLGAIA